MQFHESDYLPFDVGQLGGRLEPTALFLIEPIQQLLSFALLLLLELLFGLRQRGDEFVEVLAPDSIEALD